MIQPGGGEYTEDLPNRLHRVLASLGERVRHRDSVAATAHIEAGEYVPAIERIAKSLCDHDVPITDVERSELLDLAEVLNSNDAAVSIDLCPEMEFGTETRVSVVMGVGRRIGRGIFVVVMAVIFVVSAGLGLTNTKDALDQQPVLWGTFTEQRCEPDLHGCRSFGRWVSDDGSIVKEGIYLDGSPGSDGTVRAAYKPEGLFNETTTTLFTWSGRTVWGCGSRGSCALSPRVQPSITRVNGAGRKPVRQEDDRNTNLQTSGRRQRLGDPEWRRRNASKRWN